MKKIILLLAFTSYSFSQGEVTSLSLSDAVEYGIENNRNLVNAEREIKMAYKERWKTIAIGLPNVTLDLNYLNYLELPTSLIPAEFFGGQKGEFSEIQCEIKCDLAAITNDSNVRIILVRLGTHFCQKKNQYLNTFSVKKKMTI